MYAHASFAARWSPGSTDTSLPIGRPAVAVNGSPASGMAAGRFAAPSSLTDGQPT
jgi:hypothetical protein